MNLSEWARARSQGLLQPVGQGLHRLGIGADAVTVAGFLGMVAAAGLVAQGRLAAAGVTVALAAGLDSVDGAVARAARTVGRRGAFLDSTLDRVAELAVFLGLLIHVLPGGDYALPVLTLVALSGSFMVSYARSRAEGLGLECRVGLFTRLERVVVLVVGLVVGQVFWMLVLLAAMTWVTVAQRFLHVWRKA